MLSIATSTVTQLSQMPWLPCLERAFPATGESKALDGGGPRGHLAVVHDQGLGV